MAKTKLKQILATLLAMVMVISMIPMTATVFATVGDYESNQRIDYVFTGPEAGLAGYAEGNVGITPDRNSGYCHLYWANDEGILDDYEQIVSRKFTSSEPFTYKMPENMVIPSEAKYLAAFFSDTAELGSADLSTAELVEIPESKRFNSGKLEMNFASVSDVHVNYEGAPELWTSALNYFGELGLEMVLVSGDMTDKGTKAEYETYIDCIEASSYPLENVYASRGNHEATANSNYITYTSRPDQVRPTASSPWSYVLKEGAEGEKDNLFIFLAQEIGKSTGNSKWVDNFSDEQLDWFESVLEQFAGTNTNIFVLQHAPIRNWGAGDKYNGGYGEHMVLQYNYPGNMRFQRLLMEYKEIIVMSGHTHAAFNQMVNYSDENGTGCRTIHNSSVAKTREYGASGASLSNKPGTSEGYVVEVYENDIVYYGTDLVTKKKIPTACYIMESYSEDRSQATEISITKAPDMIYYTAGEYFYPSGMEVTATFADGSAKIVKGWGLENNYELEAGTQSITIVYGNLQTSVSIDMSDIYSQFEGEGTYESPYLVSTPEDFMVLTKGFASVSGTSIHDNNTFGKGKYFLQTADIDLTSYKQYMGTGASETNLYGFSGVYNGNGHTITVDIAAKKESDGGRPNDASIFPNLNGVIMNLRLEGRFGGGARVQIIRTIGENGYVINCSTSMNIDAVNYASGLAYANYGTVVRYFSNSILTVVSGSSKTKRAFSYTDSGSYSYTDCYYDGSGYVVKNTGTKVTDYAQTIEHLNDMTSASATKAVTLLQAFHSEFTADDLALWDNMSLVPATPSALSVLQQAIDNANEGDTITLSENVTFDAPLVINKSITLDLGEFTITSTADVALRIFGDETVNVTINATTGGIDAQNIAIYAGNDENDEAKNNVTINGGTYVSAGTDCILQINGLCTINGGTFKSSFGRTVLNGVRWYGAEFKINGGTFYGFNPACVSVWTGFDGKDYTNFYHQHDIIGEGMTAEYADGWYTVVEGDTFDAKVRTKSLCYPSVDVAIQSIVDMNDVANLGVLTLVADDTLTKAELAATNNFSFILNGKTLTLPEGYELYAVTLEDGRAAMKIKAVVVAEGSDTTATETVEVGTADELIAAMDDGKIIVVNADFAVDFNLTLADGSILDLNGHTITLPKKGITVSGKNITVKNGTFNCAVKSGHQYTLYIAEGTAATIEDVTLKGAIYAKNGAELTLKDNDIKPWASGNASAVYAYGAKVTILSGKFAGSTQGVCKEAFGGEITIYGGSFDRKNASYKNPLANFVAEGYEVVRAVDGTYKYEVKAK